MKDDGNEKRNDNEILQTWKESRPKPKEPNRIHDNEFQRAAQTFEPDSDDGVAIYTS